MLNRSDSKVYGLSFPTRKKDDEDKKRIDSIFASENSDEEQDQLQFQKPLRIPQTKHVQQAKLHRKTKSDYERALEEDPSVFQYDEIYDEIKNVKEDVTLGKTVKESKYVNRLLKTANERKLERELCLERKAQREIEAEADLYGQKESFVTSAYKARINEINELVAKREQEKLVEERMDITTQEGLGGLYRYMYEHGIDKPEKISEQLVDKSGKVQDSGTDNLSGHADQPNQRGCFSSINHSLKNAKNEQLDFKHSNSSSRSLPSDSMRIADQNERNRRSQQNEKNSESSSSPRSTSQRSRFPKQKSPMPDSPQTVGPSEKKVPDLTSIKPTTTGSSPRDPNFVYARPRVTTDDQLKEARERYLQRKAEGIHAVIVESDTDDE